VLAAAVAVIVDMGIDRLEIFSQYVGMSPDGRPMTDGGLLGALQEIAATSPFEILYGLKVPVATGAGFAVVLLYARVLHLGCLKLLAMGVTEGRWTLHLRQRPEPRKALGAALTAALSWAVAFGVCRLVLRAVEGAAGATSRFGLSPPLPASLVEQPALVSAGVAVAAALLLLWRYLGFQRRRAEILVGHIEH
jgi:hypothetical protein